MSDTNAQEENTYTTTVSTKQPKDNATLPVLCEVPINFRPWKAPHFASMTMSPTFRTTEDIARLPPIHVSALPKEALDGLAQQWIDDLYATAGIANRWVRMEVE